MGTESESEAVTWRPNSPAQYRFMAATEYEGLFGGSRGPGKSVALAVMALRYVKKATYKAAIFRRTYPQLLELTDCAARLYRAAGGVGRDNNTEFRFPSGAQILFRHLQHEKDCDNYQGHQYQFLGYDELCHFTFKQYDTMRACCRTADPEIRCMIRATANPGGIGHRWCKEYFIDTCPPVNVGAPIHDAVFDVMWQPQEPGTGYISPEGLSRQFYPAKVFDNADLLKANPEYVKNLKSLAPAMRSAYLDGDWNVFQGQFWPEFNEMLHVRPPWPVSEGSDEWGIPPTWKRIGGIDYGSRNPWAAVEAAVDPATGRVIVYRTISAPGWTHEMQAQWLLAGSPACDWVADDQCFVRGNRDDGKVIQMTDAELWGKHGFNRVRPAHKGHRPPGWAHMREFLKPFDETGRTAWLEIMDTPGARGKYGLITCLQLAVYSEKNPEDMESDSDDAPDHVLDAMRYLCLQRPLPAPPAVVKPVRERYGVDRREITAPKSGSAGIMGW